MCADCAGASREGVVWAKLARVGRNTKLNSKNAGPSSRCLSHYLWGKLTRSTVFPAARFLKQRHRSGESKFSTGAAGKRLNPAESGISFASTYFIGTNDSAGRAPRAGGRPGRGSVESDADGAGKSCRSPRARVRPQPSAPGACAGSPRFLRAERAIH